MQLTFEDATATDLIKQFDFVVKLRSPEKMSDDEFFDFCQKFEVERVERTAEGEIVIMPSSGFVTSERNAELIMQLRNWAKKDGRGFVTDSNGGYILSNSAMRSPDAAWILKERVEKVSASKREKFLPLCPDFVVELTSPSDSLREIKEKMLEYIENGAQMGWLIHRKTKQVFVYRPNTNVEILENLEKISGAPLLTDFELDLREIW